MNVSPLSGLDLATCADVAPELAEICVSIASDIALVVDEAGIVQAARVKGSGFPVDIENISGRHWAELVTDDTRAKIGLLMTEVIAEGRTRSREVNLGGDQGQEIPVKFAAIRLGESKTYLVAGCDLTVVSQIQQRFVERQQSLEKEYWEQRRLEGRYRLLFQAATDAVLVVDPSNFRVIDANPSGSRLFGTSSDELIGSDFASNFPLLYQVPIRELLVTTKASGQAAEIRVPIAFDGSRIELTASPLRSPDGVQVLLRARHIETAAATGGSDRALIDFVQRSPDAVVITDAGGKIIMANPAFHSLFDPSSRTEISGIPLAQLLDCPADEFAQTIAELREHGISSKIQSSDRGRVSITGILLEESDQDTLGFCIRPETSSVEIESDQRRGLSVKLTAPGFELSGTDLPTLLSRANLLLEKHLIRSALEQCAGSEEQAASVLGITVDGLRQRQDLHADADADDKPSLR